MINQKTLGYDVRLRDLFRLMRVEDYGTFIQLIIGFVLAGGRDWMYLAGALTILAPCVYGGLYALNDAHDADADRLHPLKKTRPVAAGRIDPQLATMLGTGFRYRWQSIGAGSALYRHQPCLYVQVQDGALPRNPLEYDHPSLTICGRFVARWQLGALHPAGSMVSGCTGNHHTQTNQGNARVRPGGPPGVEAL
jgi:hypothetical protein